MLQREEFLLFAVGFSLSLMLKQSITLFVDFKKQNILNFVMLFSWSLYILIQGTNAWNVLYHRPVLDPRFLAASTILYTITIMCTLYMSMIRVIALNCNGSSTLTRLVKKTMFPLLLILAFIRCLRTAFLLIQKTNVNSSPSPIIAELQLASMVPILVLRIVFDSLSLISLFSISKDFVQTDEKASLSISTISISLVFEICIAVVSIVVAVLETIKYQGDCIAFQDWWLISWSISSLIEQRSHYVAIFSFVKDKDSLNPASSGSSLKSSRSTVFSHSSSRKNHLSIESDFSVQTLTFPRNVNSASTSRSSNKDVSRYSRFEV